MRMSWTNILPSSPLMTEQGWKRGADAHKHTPLKMTKHTRLLVFPANELYVHSYNFYVHNMCAAMCIWRSKPTISLPCRFFFLYNEASCFRLHKQKHKDVSDVPIQVFYLKLRISRYYARTHIIITLHFLFIRPFVWMDVTQVNLVSVSS